MTQSGRGPRPAGGAHPAPLLLLDACTVINLFASRRMIEILQAQNQPAGIVEAVHRETVYVFKGGDGDDAREREPVDLSPVIASGTLWLVDPTDVELDDFIDLTLYFKGDGEAMTIAVALARGWIVVTDDRKAIRVIAGRTQIRSSLDLVKTWAETLAIGESDLRTVLHDLRARGHYTPGKEHPLRSWWDLVLPDG